jgi:lysophospholipase L1-like esterase
MAGPGRSQLDRALRVLSALIIIVVSVLGATELLMRAIFEAPLKPYTQHTLYRATRTPNYKAFKTSVEDGTPFEYVVNPLGFRGKSMQTVKKPAGVFRIFFVGASTTENQHLPEEKTFPGLVEQALTAKGMKVEVANCGIAGHGVARSFSLIVHRVLELEPDLIVLLDGENDMLQSLDPLFDPANGPGPDSEKIKLKDWLLSRSRLIQVLDTPKEVDTRPFLELRRKEARKKPYSAPQDLERGLPTFERYLRLIALVLDERKVPLCFLTQPTLWKEQSSEPEVAAMWMTCSPNGPLHLDPKTSRRLMDRYNDAVRAAAKDHLLVDLDRLVPRDLDHLYDDAHMTARGNKLVADEIVKELVARGVVRAP